MSLFSRILSATTGRSSRLTTPTPDTASRFTIGQKSAGGASATAAAAKGGFQPVISTNVAGIRWVPPPSAAKKGINDNFPDGMQGTLEVMFRAKTSKKGKKRAESVYAYFFVPKKVHEEMYHARSKGKFVHQRLKGKFSYRKIRG